MDISTIYIVLYPDIKSQNCIRIIVMTMVPKLVLQNEHDILSYCGTHMSENITKMQEKMRSWISVSVFLVNSVKCSSCFQICTLACTLAIAVQSELLSSALAAISVPFSYFSIVPLKKIKTKKQDSVALGMRFRIQTTGKCESWAATCETVLYKF